MTFFSSVAAFAMTSFWIWFLGSPLVDTTLPIPYTQLVVIIATISFFIWFLSSTLTPSSFSGDCLDQFCFASGSRHLDKKTLAGEVAPGESQVIFIKYGSCPKKVAMLKAIS